MRESEEGLFFGDEVLVTITVIGGAASGNPVAEVFLIS